MNLLRADIVRPLSTDRMVWGRPPEAEQYLESPMLFGMEGLYADLTELHKIVHATGSPVRPPYWLIAITLEWEFWSRADKQLWRPDLPETVPSARKLEWPFLGYDVSDEALISGLSNCGFEPGEKERLDPKWGKLLNEYHLFTSLPEAIEFASVTDERVPEHSPFLVYGLYRIPE